MKCEDIKQFTSCGSYCVNVTMEQLVHTIKEEEEKLGLILNSEVQRGHVWDEEQQIAFIEYFLRGGKSGLDLYFNNPDWGKNYGDYHEFVCVDGLQRITAVRRFMNNEIPAFGIYRKDFEDDWMFTHDFRHMFNIHVNDLKTKEEVLTWYIEMNTGGTPHTKEEIAKVQKILNELKEEKSEQEIERE